MFLWSAIFLYYWIFFMVKEAEDWQIGRTFSSLCNGSETSLGQASLPASLFSLNSCIVKCIKWLLLPVMQCKAHCLLCKCFRFFKIEIKFLYQLQLTKHWIIFQLDWLHYCMTFFRLLFSITSKHFLTKHFTLVFLFSLTIS